MDGYLGGFTRWAIVFLIIFVLFFLLVPGYGGYTAAAATPCGCQGWYGGHGLYGGYGSGYGY
jgi:hypothetical protein